MKAAIIAESYSKQETVCAVARQHGLIPSQLFTWRRQLRTQMEARGVTLPVAPTMEPAFVPAIIEEPPLIETVPAKRPCKRRPARDSAVERSIRPLALNRKNALFAGSDEGGINPHDWLTQTLTALANGPPQIAFTNSCPGSTWAETTAYVWCVK